MAAVTVFGFEECTKVEGQHMVVENCRIINDPRWGLRYPGRPLTAEELREAAAKAGQIAQ